MRFCLKVVTASDRGLCRRSWEVVHDEDIIGNGEGVDQREPCKIGRVPVPSKNRI